jgi:hypothetical protein
MKLMAKMGKTLEKRTKREALIRVRAARARELQHLERSSRRLARAPCAANGDRREEEGEAAPQED